MQVVLQNNQKAELKLKLSDVGAEHVFLVRGGRSYSLSGAEEFVNSLFGYKQLTSFSDFDVNPNVNDLEKGLALFRKGSYKIIVAIGGGSVLDMAKLLGIFAHQKARPEDAIKGKAKLLNEAVPVYAIPTTAGTGAEATHFAVVYIDKKKYSLAHAKMLPSHVYLSSEFSLSADAYLTACTGLDALCQAVESVWCVNANEESLEYAFEAIDICYKNLAPAVKRNNAKAKQAMQLAAYLAGKAINITKTTAPHAISYPFTSYYNIPHGHAVALSLPFFYDFNYGVTEKDCTDQRGAQEVRLRMDKIASVIGSKPGDVSDTLNDFFKSLGITIHIPELIQNFSKKIILDNINAERLNNNPRRVSIDVVSEFLNQ